MLVRKHTTFCARIIGHEPIVRIPVPVVYFGSWSPEKNKLVVNKSYGNGGTLNVLLRS